MGYRIGIDIDGVLADFVSSYAEILSDVTGMTFDLSKITTWDWPQENFGIDSELVDVVWEHIDDSDSHWIDLGLHQGAAEDFDLLQRLQFDHDLYFITNRTNGQDIKRQTEWWLRKHGIDFPTVLLARRKASIVRDLALDAFIDDRDSTVNEVATVARGTQPFLFNRPWNLGNGHHPRVTRVHSIREMWRTING